MSKTVEPDNDDLDIEEDCGACDGTTTCQTCGGNDDDCGDCDGSGDCTECDGSGTVS